MNVKEHMGLCLFSSPKVFQKFPGFLSEHLYRLNLGSHYQREFSSALYMTLTSLISYDLCNTYSNPFAFTRVLQV